MSGTNGQLLVESTKRFDREFLQEAPETVNVGDLGEALKLTSRKPEELNHEMATEILNLPEFSSDRPLDNNHVLRLLNAMKRGTFLPEQVQLILCTCGGKTYRMNGQHTCWARLEMDKGYRCPVLVLRYSAKTENDMRRLYASIDRMKARSNGNVVTSYLFDTPEWKGYSRRTLTKLAEALGFFLWESDRDRTSHDGDHRSYLLMTDYYALGKKVADFLEASKGNDGAHIRRRPVIAAMLPMFQKSKESAEEFWSAVRDGVGIGSQNDPRLRLRNELTRASINIGNGAAVEKKSVSGEEVYRWCIFAWNAFRRGDQVKQLKAPLGTARPKAV